MSDLLDCDAMRQLAPELALGGLTGPERAVAIEHLCQCGECQSYVDELAAVADRLLLLAPEDEPSAGFESRVLARMAQVRPTARRRRPRMMALSAAAVLAVVVAAAFGGAAAIRHTDRTQIGINKEYIAALQHLGGRSLRAAPLTNAQGARVGQAFMYDGTPSWVFVSLDHNGADGTYTVVCTGNGAGPVSWPGLHVAEGHGTLAWTVQGDVRSLDHIQVIDAAGHTPYTARFDPSV
jgi:hypothetical protein